MKTTIVGSYGDILQELYQGLRVTRDGNYSAAAAASLIAYDIGYTFFDEVDFIWRGQFSIPKVLYLLSRYYGLLYLITILAVETNTKLKPEFCRNWFYFYALGGNIFFTTIVNMVFIIRIYALYQKSRKILILFISLCSMEFVFEFAASYFSAKHAADSLMVAPLGIPWPGCLSIPLPQTLTLLAWIPALILMLIFFAFTIIKFQGAFRELAMAKSQHQRTFSPMMVVFIRDGSLYFGLIFAILLVNTILVVHGNAGLGLSAVPWQIAVYSLAGSHLILDLWKAGQRGLHENSTQVASDFPGSIFFAQRSGLGQTSTQTNTITS
ncbi:hypothetical protein CPB83DRAFT_853911 [Crepidotus variabilis]|uniref:DUF6533 domain-containing protein n=1 Tax=Crepidotus variabilis TaxID=179855 RepID=A0A9P6EFH9_9AGAR|nr:hypothetical protein CPB83DRAFT_853911 [Crepidotus variabilis]